MKTNSPSLRSLHALVAFAVWGMFPHFVHAQDPAETRVPVVSIRTGVAETREPYCDPAVCDAALPAPGVFVLTRLGGDPARELFVSLDYDGTAKNGEDYAELPKAVQFPAGETTVELRVEAAYDKLVEGDEVAVARIEPDPTLGPVERYRVDPESNTARIVIHDNEAPAEPLVSIEATRPIAEESSFPYRRLPLRGQFTIRRTGPTEQALSVFVHYRGTATPGEDHPFLPWFATIPAGSSHVEIDVVPHTDDVPEPIETVEATLSGCPPFTIPPLGLPCRELNMDPARATATVFIRDDGIATASLAITSPKHGADFEPGEPVHIAVTALDLEGAITHVEFFDGETKIGESTINFFREPDPGVPVHHEMEWTEAATGPHVLTAAALNAAGERIRSLPVRIQVGDRLPVVSIETAVPETYEPLCPPDTCLAPASAPGVFVIRRHGGDLTRPLVVLLRAGGSASPRDDYDALPEKVEIPAGEEAVELSVTALYDELVEGDETVLAALRVDPFPGPAAWYRIDPEHSIARVVIHDRTPPVVPVVTIVTADAFAREGGNPVNTAAFQLRRVGDLDSDLTVLISAGGTALNGVDYEQIPEQITIPAGSRSVRIVVTPLDDDLKERLETVVLRLVEPPVPLPVPPVPPSYHVGFPGRAAAVILDNDQPRPLCERLADGLFNVCQPGNEAHCFRVETTDDLEQWTPLCIVPVSEGMAQFVDPDASTAPRRFYRLVPVACEPEE